MKSTAPKQSTMAFIAASLLRLNRMATITEVEQDLADHGVEYASRVVRVYLQRMHASGLLDKYEVKKRGSTGESVVHEISKKGREFVGYWQRVLSVSV